VLSVSTAARKLSASICGRIHSPRQAESLARAF
jgi:hypothetical protein